jgi:hypothetical protein
MEVYDEAAGGAFLSAPIRALHRSARSALQDNAVSLTELYNADDHPLFVAPPTPAHQTDSERRASISASAQHPSVYDIEHRLTRAASEYSASASCTPVLNRASSASATPVRLSRCAVHVFVWVGVRECQAMNVSVMQTLLCRCCVDRITQARGFWGSQF